MDPLATSSPKPTAEPRRQRLLRRVMLLVFVAVLLLGMLILAAVIWHINVTVPKLDLHHAPNVWWADLVPLLWPGILLARGGMHHAWVVGMLAVLVLIGIFMVLGMRYTRRRLGWLWVPVVCFVLSIGYCALGEQMLARSIPLSVTTRFDDQPEQLAEFNEEFSVGFRRGEIGVYIDVLGGGLSLGFSNGQNAGVRVFYRLIGHAYAHHNTPLPWAVIHGDEQEVERLLKGGADTDARVWNNLTPLMVSITNGPASVSMVELLLRHGADINAMTTFQKTALYYATSPSCPMETFEYLLTAGADPGKSHPLRIAAFYGDIPRATRLLQVASERGIELQLNEAMVSAATAGQPEMVTFLLEQGAEIDHQDADGETALIRVINDAYVKKVEILRLLLEHGANVELPDTKGRTALMHAVSKNRSNFRNFSWEPVRLLLEYGASLDTRDSAGQTACDLFEPEIYPDGKGKPTAREILKAMQPQAPIKKETSLE